MQHLGPEKCNYGSMLCQILSIYTFSNSTSYLGIPPYKNIPSNRVIHSLIKPGKMLVFSYVFYLRNLD